jgi:hypothetical protein
MLFFKLAHLLLLVYWLGADVGTFYASRFVANANLPVAARSTAAQIMLGVDIAPRLCMPLMLATGFQLARMQGWLAWPDAVLAGMWALCAAWLGVVVWLHHHGRSALGLRVASLDFYFRAVLLAVLSLVALASLAGLWVQWPAWLAIKLLCFAITVACGLMIRVHLRPFGAAFALMVSGQGGGDSNQVIAQAISRCLPYVVLIWVLLVVAAACGLRLLG